MLALAHIIAIWAIVTYLVALIGLSSSWKDTTKKVALIVIYILAIILTVFCW